MRKLTRYAPVKKNTPAPGDGAFTSPTNEPGSASDEKKRDERPMHPSVYNSYFHPIAGNLSMNGGQPDAAAFNRNFLMPSVGPSNGPWLESWNCQESASSMNARMMALPPHFAYAMMPMHAAAAMHHMNATQGHHLPTPVVGLQASASSNNPVRIDPARQSDLSNRLGFKFGPDGSVVPVETTMPQMEARSSSASSEKTAESAQVVIPQNNSLEQFQTHENRLVPSASRHALPQDHAFLPGQGHSTDYDFMMEFGMFDGIPTEPYAAHTAALTSPSSSSSNGSVGFGLGLGSGVAGAGHAFQQVGHSAHPMMRLPTLTHDLPMVLLNPLEHNNALLSAATALRASPTMVCKPAAASHAHASLEVEITAHSPVAEEHGHEHEHSEDSVAAQEDSPLATSTAPAAAAAKGAPVDMACNTMLTYSKIHDALVYYRISDV